jgi:Leucine-rich repeat (LRR) protein
MQAAPTETWTFFARQQATVQQQNIVAHSLPDKQVLLLLPLHGYQNKLSIALPLLPGQTIGTILLTKPVIGLSQWLSSYQGLPTIKEMDTISLPAELIELIQQYCSHTDLLVLTAVNKAALATRFDQPRLQHLHFKTVLQIEQLFAHCWETQQSALLTGAARIREHFQAVKVLTLALSEQLTFKQSERLFICLPGVTQLRIQLALTQSYASLAPLLQAAKRYLGVSELSIEKHTSDTPPNDTLPDVLWELTTLQTLSLEGFTGVSDHIFEPIRKLTLSGSLHLENIPQLTVLPKSLGQLSKLENLELVDFEGVASLPDEIGQLTSLKTLSLDGLWSLKTLPKSLGQLSKLKELNLHHIDIAALPEEIGQLKALKVFYVKNSEIKFLPEGLGQLLKLEKLHIIAPNLEALPKSIAQLSALKKLTLSGPRDIEALPNTVGRLTALKKLKVEQCQNLNALPINLKHLTRLKQLTLLNLPRLRILPEEISQLPALKRLSLRLPSLMTLPATLDQAPALQTIVIEQANPGFVIPPSCVPFIKKN